jgi:pimeloyl-ACP methyl ester carboxylesterase
LPARIELPGADLRLRADVAGPADGPPVLLIHGGGQTRSSWGRALEQLAARGARAYAIDLRGHGESEWSPDGAYRPEDHAADLVRIMPTLGPEPVILVGASLGGMAALLATPQLGDRVAGLVLVDVVPRLRIAGAERILAFMRSAPDGFADLESAADAVSAYLPHRPRPESHDGLRRNLRQRPDGRWVWHWDPRIVPELIAEASVPQERLDRAAAALTVPTLLLRGVLSDVVDDAGVEHLQELVPHLRVVDLAGAAHTAAADDNDAFVAAVLEFVPGLRSA